MAPSFLYTFDATVSSGGTVVASAALSFSRWVCSAKDVEMVIRGWNQIVACPCAWGVT